MPVNGTGGTCRLQGVPERKWDAPGLKFRDCSLITGRGTTKWEGGGGRHVQFYPYEKVGRKKFQPEGGGGGTQSWSFLCGSLKLAIMKGGRKKFLLFKKGCVCGGGGGGGGKFDPVIRGGRKKFLTRKFHIL